MQTATYISESEYDTLIELLNERVALHHRHLAERHVTTHYKLAEKIYLRRQQDEETRSLNARIDAIWA